MIKRKALHNYRDNISNKSISCRKMKYNNYPVSSHNANKFSLRIIELASMVCKSNLFRALYKRNSNAEIFEDTLTPSLIPRQ